MIHLRDTVVIEASAEAVWAWLESMPDHILEWHPDHIAARWVEGGRFEPGAAMEVRERLHGKPHRLRMTVTDVEPGRWVHYRIFPGLRGTFDVLPVHGASEFTAEIEIGFDVPVVGPLLDRLLRRVLGGRVEQIRRHQAEEGVNLKRLLEGPPSAEA